MRFKLLKLFFLIASIIAFLETTAKAQATLTYEISIRPAASGLTNSEGNTIERDAFQEVTGLAFSNDGKKVFSSNRVVNGNHECVSMMTLSTPYDLRTASTVKDEASPMVTQVGLDDNDNDSKCTRCNTEMPDVSKLFGSEWICCNKCYDPHIKKCQEDFCNNEKPEYEHRPFFSINRYMRKKNGDSTNYFYSPLTANANISKSHFEHINNPSFY